MNTGRSNAIIVGVLYIIGTVAGVLSVGTGTLIVEARNSLVQVSANANQVTLGALLVLTMGLALALVPVVMYPILKKHNQVLALGYVVFRGALETVTYVGLALCWLSLVNISQQYVQAEAATASSFQPLGVLLLEGHDSIRSVLEIVFPLGALMFYYVLYQSKLIPRWLSGWGFIAAILWFTAGLLGMFGLLVPMSPTQLFFSVPIGVQEMVMALWLIIKGFNPSAITASSSTRVDTNQYQFAPQH